MKGGEHMFSYNEKEIIFSLLEEKIRHHKKRLEEIHEHLNNKNLYFPLSEQDVKSKRELFEFHEQCINELIPIKNKLFENGGETHGQ